MSAPVEIGSGSSNATEQLSYGRDPSSDFVVPADGSQGSERCHINGSTFTEDSDMGECDASVPAPVPARAPASVPASVPASFASTMRNSSDVLLSSSEPVVPIDPRVVDPKDHDLPSKPRFFNDTKTTDAESHTHDTKMTDAESHTHDTEMTDAEPNTRKPNNCTAVTMSPPFENLCHTMTMQYDVVAFFVVLNHIMGWCDPNTTSDTNIVTNIVTIFVGDLFENGGWRNIVCALMSGWQLPWERTWTELADLTGGGRERLAVIMNTVLNVFADAEVSVFVDIRDCFRRRAGADGVVGWWWAYEYELAQGDWDVFTKRIKCTEGSDGGVSVVDVALPTDRGGGTTAVYPTGSLGRSAGANSGDGGGGGGDRPQGLNSESVQDELQGQGPSFLTYFHYNCTQ